MHGNHKQAEYGKVVLPLTVLHCLDNLSIHTKAKMLELILKYDGMPKNALEAIISNDSGYKFHNKASLILKN